MQNHDYSTDEAYEARLDRMNEIVDSLNARVDELEKLGPLIGQYGSARFAMGATLSDDRWEGNAKRAEEIIIKIDAILTGGAP